MFLEARDILIVLEEIDYVESTSIHDILLWIELDLLEFQVIELSFFACTMDPVSNGP